VDAHINCRYRTAAGTQETIAISLLHLAGITQINRALQAISRNSGRVLG